MRTTTRDPITGNDVKDPDDALCVIEGKGPNALKIYFECVTSRDEYLAIAPRIPEDCSLRLYRSFEDNEAILWD